MNKLSMSKVIYALAVGFVVLFSISADAELRIASYNVALGIRTGLDTVLEAMCDETINGITRDIDILILQEASSSHKNSIVAKLEAITGSDYTRDNVSVQACDGRYVGLVYNSDTVQLVGGISLPTGGLCRSTGRYQLRPTGYGSQADIYIYSTHFHSSDTSDRLTAATQIRNDADSLPGGSYIIVAGDFNIDSSSESSYQTLLSTGIAQFFDPISRSGTWHNNSSFKDIHTQAPSTDPPGGLVPGGMDDRFDFQLVTAHTQDGEGFSYIGPSSGDCPASSHSYHAFGNNGTHPFNGDINDSSNTAQQQNVLDALVSSSDHLPVVADYQLPAIMTVTVGSIPSQAEQYETVNIAVTVENTASSSISLGADELDFSFTTNGDLLGSDSGTLYAATGPNTFYISLDTSTAGSKSGLLEVTSSSQNCENEYYSQNIYFEVIDSNIPQCLADPNTDLNVDCRINFIDFAIFAEHWQESDAIDNNTVDIEPIITGIIDGTLGTAGTPKAVEIYVPGLKDLSNYSIERSDEAGPWGNNTALTGTYQNEYVYLIGSGNNGEADFDAIWGTSGDFANRPLVSSVITHNGNDAYRLIKGTTIIDQVWLQNNTPVYENSYMYRYNATGPDGGFSIPNWYMASPNTLAGKDDSEIVAIVPFGTYIPPEGAPLPPCYNGYPIGDFDESCSVDFVDLAQMAAEWLDCNLDPQSACW